MLLSTDKSFCVYAWILGRSCRSRRSGGSGGSCSCAHSMGSVVNRQPSSLEGVLGREEDRKVTTAEFSLSLSQMLLHIIDEKRFFSGNKLFAAAADPAFFMGSTLDGRSSTTIR